MENTKQRISEIINKAPLPAKMKEYFLARLEKEGVTPILVESIKSALRAIEADAFGRMGVYVDEDNDPEIKRAVKMYSAAVEEAMKKYLATVNQAADKVVSANVKAGKKIEKIESKMLKASIA